MVKSIVEAVDNITFVPIGISRISVTDLKRFKTFCERESENDYGKGIGLLMDFYEFGITRLVMEHEEKLNNIEPKKEEKPKIIGFGGKKNE